MKLIINIPEEDYKFIKSLRSLIVGGRGNCKTIQRNVIYAIRNGTLLDNAPTGEWKIVDAENGKIWNCICTECGHDPREYINGSEDWWLRKPLPNFCPNCGVKMKGGAE